MSRIKIDPNRLNNLSTKARNIKNKTYECHASVGNVINGLDWQVASKASIDSRLNNVQRRLQRQTELMDAYVRVLGTSSDTFCNNDRKLKQDAKNLIYEMNGISAALTLVGKTSPKISYKTSDKLQKLLNVANLFGRRGIADVGIVGLSSLTKPLIRNIYTGAVVANVGNIKSRWWDKHRGEVNTVYNVSKNVIKATGSQVSKIKEMIGLGGRFESVWLATKTSTKIIGASVLITCSFASIALGNPAGMLGVVYGVNSFANAATDLWRIDQGNLGKVGKTNILKTAAKTAGEVVGVGIGAGVGYIEGGVEGAKTGATIGKSVGSMVGTVAYEAGDIVSKVVVGNVVIGDPTATYSKLKDVMDLGKASDTYKYAKNVVDWVDDPTKELVKKIIPKSKSDTNLGEMVEKATKKIVTEAAKPIKAN